MSDSLKYGKKVKENVTLLNRTSS